MGYNDENYDIAVKFWGDMACFTRPEFKTERVSYPVMTPSAARGALESIFWKPEIRWEIREIWVLEPIREFSILRNEINNRQIDQTGKPLVIENDRVRVQRASLFLKEPKYIIMADIRLKKDTQHAKMKYLSQMTRYLERGSCRQQPYLGTRECSAYFEKASGDEKPISLNMTIDNMLFDIAYCQSNDRKRQDMEFIKKEDGNRTIVKGHIRPIFFTARIEDGKMLIPFNKYEELYELEGVHVKGID